MKVHRVNEIAREHNLPERKTADKTKAKLQKVKIEMNSVSGKGGKEAYKRKGDEIEERPFDWPSPSQSQSQGENIVLKTVSSSHSAYNINLSSRCRAIY